MTKEESGELWGRIREEYIHSDLSLKKLSEKYGVSKRQLERRSAREGWPALRERSRGGPLSEDTARRLTEAVEKALRVVQDAFEDEKQFHRYLVKTKAGADGDLEERIFQKLDTKSLKEVTAVLKDLKAMVQEASGGDAQVRVVFEAGEESWNE